MYARQVKNRNLTFSVSGMLWNRSLVMLDAETKSLWSHILGEAMQGPLKGESLATIPSVMTDWKTWRTKHPNTTVVTLSRTSREYRREFYRNPSKFLIGIAEGGESRAWSFDQLQRQPVVNDRFRDQPLLIVFEKRSSTALLFDRRVDGQELRFTLRKNKLTDVETESYWDWATGRATKGPLQGKQLKPLPGTVSFRRVWTTFHPKTKLWKAP